MMNKNVICATVFMVLILRIENSYSKYIFSEVWKSKCPELDIPNANIRIRAKGRLAKIRCNSGYTMIEGDRRLSCLRKEWQGRIPHCIKSGCEEVPLENGMVIKLYGGALIHFVCNPGYSLEGSPAVFCDGFDWNSTTPECQIPTLRMDHVYCTFEYKDLCGWTQDHLDDFDWRWSSALINSFQGGLGAKVDHTFGSYTGHYVYADANEKWKSNTYARLFSPIIQVPLETPACVTFYYHLYGPTSGVFNVFIKPESILLEQLYPDMSVTGFHADEWLMAFLHLDDSLEDWFQVVLEAQGGDEHVSDFAVDDFKVSAGEDCINLELKYEEQQRTTTKKSADEQETFSTAPYSSVTLTTNDSDQEGETFTTISLLSSTIESATNIASQISTSTGDDEIFSETSSPPSTLTTGKKIIESTTVPRKVIILSTQRTLMPFTLFTPPSNKVSSPLVRKTLTPSIATTQTTTTKPTKTSVATRATTISTSKSTTKSTTKASTTSATSQKTTKTKTTSAKPTKTTTLKAKSTTTPKKTVIYTTTKSTTKTTTTPKPPRRKTTKPSTTTKSTSLIISTESSSTEFYFDEITTRKAIKVTENVESISIIKKDASNGGAVAIILGVAICFLVIGSAFAFFWHTKRKRQLLAEDSDERRLKEESKDEEQSNEVEEAPRRPFTTSYRLLENKNYPQEYDGTPV